jgi:hypothetical protein
MTGQKLFVPFRSKTCQNLNPQVVWGIMNIINLTPHALNLVSPDGTNTTVPPSGTVARVTATPGALETIPGIPVPIARPDTFYIVSAMVGARVSRSDVFTPGTGPSDNPIRNEKGQIVGVTRLKATA